MTLILRRLICGIKTRAPLKHGGIKTWTAIISEFQRNLEIRPNQRF